MHRGNETLGKQRLPITPNNERYPTASRVPHMDRLEGLKLNSNSTISHNTF